MNLEDRFTLGFISGLIAGLIMNVLNFISYYVLHIATLRYLDFMAIIVYGNKPTNSFDTILALILHLGFTGILGILYAYLTPWLGAQNHLLKGALYSVSIFFLTYAITFLFKVKDLTIVPPYTVASNIITAAIYGVVLARIYKNNFNTEA